MTSPRKKTSSRLKIAQTSAKTRIPRTKPRKRRTKTNPRKKGPVISPQKRFLCLLFEVLGIGIIALTIIMVLLGFSANWFSGTHFLTSLLPFALGILVLILLSTLLLLGWLRLRPQLHYKSPLLPASLAAAGAILVSFLLFQGQFFQAFTQFRTLVGGKAEAAKMSLTHQVYAAYRRQPTSQLQHLIDRAKPYSPEIDEAAEAFHLDPDILHGIAATESSFLPRTSKDGGKGLFQITSVPQNVMKQAARKLGVQTPSLRNHRHNTFIAAATLSYYLRQMRNDLFLGLLAYNIGPANGGLRFIMQQYGVTNFVTIQPYLKQLPRGYPIRVLSYALAFRLYRKEGKLLAYEQGLNAIRIQHLGVPGL